MSTLLHIDSSARINESISRQLTASYVAQWRQKHPEGKVIVRDLATTAVPHVTEQQIGAYFTPVEQRTNEQQHSLALSDQLVDEVLAADTILIGTPMYNFSVTSSLKAWIDHVARLGRTFAYSETGPVGLATGKRAVIAISRGGIYSEEPARGIDFESGYLKHFLGFIGVTDVELIVAEGVALGEDVAKQAIIHAEKQITATF
jgi:FMN-dependent NADH-azoreductase